MLYVQSLDNIKEHTRLFESDEPVWLSPHVRPLKVIHLRVQFDIDLLEDLQSHVFLQETHVMFLNQNDRDLYNQWVNQLDEKKSPTHVLMPFSINDILAKGDLHVAARVPYNVPNMENQYLYNSATELVRWVYKRTHRQPNNDIWYDRTSSQFLFQNADTAMEFKLKFMGEQDDQLLSA